MDALFIALRMGIVGTLCAAKTGSQKWSGEKAAERVAQGQWKFQQINRRTEMNDKVKAAVALRDAVSMRGWGNADQAVGKRIEKITEFSIDPLVLTFTDGTYMVFQIEEVQGNGPSICHQSYRRLSKEQMVKAGILSQAQGIEYQEALDVIAAHEKERVMLATRNERLKQYEELKKEFEPQEN
jgi:fatty acid-binding protein DegV